MFLVQIVPQYSNTAFGITAMDAITTGDDNTAVGHNAGDDSITSGASNTAVGHQCFIRLIPQQMIILHLGNGCSVH